MKQRWFIEQKKQHVASWRASGLTRQQYCELHDIPFTSFREWPRMSQRLNDVPANLRYCLFISPKHHHLLDPFHLQ